jgi:hypothetical protein
LRFSFLYLVLPLWAAHLARDVKLDVLPRSGSGNTTLRASRADTPVNNPRPTLT